MLGRSFVPVLASAAFLAACAQRPGDTDGAAAEFDDSQAITLRSPQVSLAAHHDASPPLMLMEQAARQPRIEREPKPIPRGPAGNFVALPRIQVQNTTPSLMMPTTLLSFDGVGDGFAGPGGTFSVNSAPPDTNGDVGPNHYVQVVNTDFAVFNKSGTAVYGPVPINTLWSGFGGGCQTNNDGDPVVLYDPIADRWVISQFSVSTTPYLQCVAVSQTPDPTGAYYRYSFSYGNTNFNDYPKMGVWPDAYYTTFNIFANMASFSGAQVCAYDRAKMLTGAAATQQCFMTNNQWGGLLPADMDGHRAPPAGAPNYVIAFGTNDLGIWKFHVDWTTPSNTTFTGPTLLPVAAFSDACNDGTCIPQSGTTQKLDSLADRLMFRLAYRNFGDHEALVVTHSVTAGSSVGVRWYELRPDASRNLSVFQQGTYAPDSGYRWMGSMAQDQQGNMALGFSLSSSSLHPEIHYTGRLAGDAAGQMTQGEGTIINGAGSQIGGSTNTPTLTRWGDYSMMSVDPSDDCTFWYTTEYIATNGAFNWHTRIGSFKFPGCGSTTGSNDFSITASPGTLSLNAGGSGTSTISTAVTAGSAAAVALAVSGAPSGMTASVSPASVTAGGSATLTVNAGSAAAGNYTLTVTGTEGSASHSATVSVSVAAQPTTAISVSPSSLSIAQGSSGNVSVTNTGNSSFTWSVGGLPSGASAAPASGTLAAGSSASVVISAGSAATGTSTVSFTATGASTATASLSLTITAPVANDFSISASPASVSVTAGGSATSTISTSVTSGSAQTVTLSASGLPTGATASLSPASINSGGSSTLTIATTSSTPAGNYTVTVSGKGTSATHATTVALSVSAQTTGGGLTNGDFEAGSLSGWTSSGASESAVASGCHGGTYCARLGSTSPTNGDSSIAQTFTAPSNASSLSFWYKETCPDTLTYDWAVATLKDNTAGSTSTVLAKTCTSNAWTQVSAAVTAGHSYTLTLTSHDDNYSSDPTYTLFDDVAFGAAVSGGGVTNGDFETGTTGGWSATGSTAITIYSHSGSYAAVVGDANPTGTSTLSQTFTAPGGATSLSLYYANNCPDTVTYDWVTITLRDNTAGTTRTILPKTCAASYVWTPLSASVTGGHSYTLTLTNRDDNYPGDPTYTLFDDIVLK